MKYTELKGLSREELLGKEKELRLKLFGMKFKHEVGQLKETHLVSDVKKKIARIQTALTQLGN